MKLPNLTILSGQQLSNSVPLVSVDKATVFAAAAFTGVITIQLSGDDETTWHNGPALAALAMVSINPALASHIRLSSTLAEGADRVNFLHAGGPNVV